MFKLRSNVTLSGDDVTSLFKEEDLSCFLILAEGGETFI